MQGTSRGTLRGVTRPRLPLPDLPLPKGALARLGHGMLRAPFGISRVAAHPRGHLVLASGGNDTAVWDLARGERRPWLQHTAPVHAIGFSGDGKRFVLLDGDDGSIDDVASDEELATIRPGKSLAGALSGDGETLVAATRDRKLRLCSTRDGKLLRAVPGPKQVEQLHVDRRATRALVVSEQALRLLDLDDGRELWSFAAPERERLEAATLSPDGARVHLLLRRQDGEVELETVRVLDAAREWVVRALGGQIWRACLAVSGHHLAHGAGGTDVVVLRDARTGRVVWTARIGGDASALSFAGKRLWVGSRAAVIALDLATGAAIPLAPGPLSEIRAVSLSGERALVRADPHAIHLLALDGASAHTIPVEQTMGCAFSPDGREVVVSDGQHRVAVHRVSDGKRMRAAELPDIHCALAWSPGGERIAAGSYVGAVMLLDARTLELGKQLEVHHGMLDRMAWTPDGKWFVTSESYKVPRLWDRSGRRAGKLAWKKDDVWRWSLAGNERLFTWHGDTLREWALPQGKLVRELALNRTGERRASGFAVAPAGDQIAWGSRYLHEVHLADLSAPEPTSMVIGEHDGGCEALAFSADGTRLVSGGTEGTLLVWDLGSASRTKAREREPRAKPRQPKRSRPLRAVALDPPASPELAALLQGKAKGGLRLRTPGSLALGDGKLVLADPVNAHEAEPIAVPAGRHAVSLVVESFERRYDEARGVLLRFAKGRPARWVSVFGARRGKPLGASVDSATLVLTSAARARALEEDTDDLKALFATSAQQTHALAKGWALVGPRASNALILSTGSDGGYPAYLGLDARDRPLVLAVPVRY